MENINSLPIQPKNGDVHIIYWLALSIVCIVLDYLTGPLIQFPIFLIVPIALSSWYNGKIWGIALSIVLPLIRMSFILFWSAPWTLWEAGVNTIIRILVFLFFSILIDINSQHQKYLSRKVRILEGFLPICSFCKKIRTDKGEWQKIEKYISEHSEARFTHGLCPECVRENYADIINE